MKIKANYLKNVGMFIISLSLFSCTGYNYINNAPITPFFKEKHTYKGTVNLSLHHLEANIAVTPIKYLGLTASYFIPTNDILGVTHRTFSFEISPLLWLPLYDKQTTKGIKLFTDLQLGYGTGRTNSQESRGYFIANGTNYGNSNWQKIFIQPSLYMHIPTKRSISHIIGIGTKLNFIRFGDLSYREEYLIGDDITTVKNTYVATQINDGNIMELYLSYSFKVKFFQFNVQPYWAYQTYFPGMLHSSILESTDGYNSHNNTFDAQTNQTSSIIYYDKFRLNFSVTFLIEGLKKKTADNPAEDIPYRLD